MFVLRRSTVAAKDCIAGRHHTAEGILDRLPITGHDERIMQRQLVPAQPQHEFVLWSLRRRNLRPCFIECVRSEVELRRPEWFDHSAAQVFIASFD